MDFQDRHLLTLAQAAFPLVSRPFLDLGDRVGLGEEAVIARLAALKQARIVRRIGPVFEPGALGITTELAAAEVHPDRIEAVGAKVAAWPQVTHCYERDHRLNLWFAGAAASPDWFGQAIKQIANWDGVKEAWRLPTVRRFKIGVVFDLAQEHPCAGSAERKVAAAHSAPMATPNLDPADWGLLRVLEADLPLCGAPFSALATQWQRGEDDLLGAIQAWLTSGRMRRYGAQLNHRRLGFAANAMAVWAAPADQLGTAGAMMACDAEVTHCYERPAFDGFPFNLYAMIHGRSRERCAAVAERLTRACGLDDPLLLFSSREFKKSSPPLSQLLASSA
jgi:DNA-binding Lrp family transcriptional regulator